MDSVAMALAEQLEDLAALCRKLIGELAQYRAIDEEEARLDGIIKGGRADG